MNGCCFWSFQYQVVYQILSNRAHCLMFSIGMHFKTIGGFAFT
ncbi:hypothetical protein [uncultured Gammaproteobacteria bacterium]|nr:hypothetical protein [uncultured Gammaproteobacteria bacterium]